MADKRLVVYEADPAAAEFGRLQPLSAQQAVGVPIPAFASGPTTPALGSVAGQAFLNTTSGQAFVWSGGQWDPIVPSAITSYANDNALVGDAPPIGTYGAAQDTGNMYVRTNTGWRAVGIRTYPLQTALLADTPAEGSLSIAMDTGGVFLREANAWRSVGFRHYPDSPTLLADLTQREGTMAIDDARGILYAFAQGAWQPKTVWLQNEAGILGWANAATGQMAVATDTGRLFVWDGTTWTGSPVRYYATEVLMQADTPPDGILAFAEDTGLIYGRAGGVWRRANSPTVTVGATPPTNPTSGDILIDPAVSTAQYFNGANWAEFGGAPVGTISMYPSFNMPAGYLLCDGQAIDQNLYPRLFALLGPNVPDLGNQFVRGAISGQTFASGLIQHESTTGLPRNPFTVSADGVHDHDITVKGGTTSDARNADAFAVNNGVFARGGNPVTVTGDPKIQNAGSHTHTIAGGDPETAPDHVYLAYMIKHD